MLYFAHGGEEHVTKSSLSNMPIVLGVLAAAAVVLAVVLYVRRKAKHRTPDEKQPD
jgi:hypothetical protein